MRSTYVKNLVVAVILLLWTWPVVAGLEFYDGGIHDIDYAVSDYVVVYNGTTVNVLDGASIPELDGWGASTINVYGGWMDFLMVDEGSLANIYGGGTWGAAVFSMNESISEINIFGCSGLGWLYADLNGIMTINGSGFAVDGTSVGYVELTGSGQLAGILNNGDAINAFFEIYSNGRIVLVPEPATLLLLGLGGLTLMRRRCKK